MTVEANAFLRADAASDGVIPNLYDEVAEKFVYEKEVFRPLGIDKSGMIKGKAGDNITIYKETQFEVGQLTEAVDTPVSALNFNSVNLTLNWYGDAKQISKEALSESFDFVWDDIRFGASNALAENRDNQIMTEWLNTTSSAIYPISSGVTRVNSSNIASTNVFTYEQITQAWLTMRVNKRLIFAVIAYPNQLKTLMNDDKFIDEDYRNAGRINGEIGRVLVGNPKGVSIIPHTAVQSTTENSTTVYQAIALGDRAFVYAEKVAPVFEFDEEIKRKRAITFHYYEAFGVKNLHIESIIPIKSA